MNFGHWDGLEDANVRLSDLYNLAAKSGIEVPSFKSKTYNEFFERRVADLYTWVFKNIRTKR